jgi:hypothetical protein
MPAVWLGLIGFKKTKSPQFLADWPAHSHKPSVMRKDARKQAPVRVIAKPKPHAGIFYQARDARIMDM